MTAKEQFYFRVLKQAVLTAGGHLPVDPAFSDKANDESLLLEFGSGIVSILHEDDVPKEASK